MPDLDLCDICGERTASVFGADDDWDGQLESDEAVCSWCALLFWGREDADA